MIRKNLLPALLSFLLLSITLFLPLASATNVKFPDTYRTGLDKEIIYFVMPDRYRNGDTSNDRLPGFEPTQTAFFHGGDLKGLTGNCRDDDGLARLKRLGFTAIWLSPLVVQQPPTGSGAGYHGYWGSDFLNVEPHLGTNQDLIELGKCAEALGLKLILDVVTNHTGDMIWYQGKEAYIPEKFKGAKKPDWLNELNNYHNVGDMNNCWSNGSCTRDGDFYGLDDLATEKPVVYKGWGDLYGSWIERFGFVGFRVDTARHVDNEFFKNWSPLIKQRAKALGIDKFTIFGEVWEESPIELVRYVRENKIETVLDFPFQRVAVDYAASSSGAEVLKNLFDYDDYYTSPDSSAQNLVTFLGNHDMGRVAFLIDTKRANPEEQLLARVKLAHTLLYFSRGTPVVYYGDEVGMTGSGDGSDQRARQDMFATQVQIWKAEKRVGSTPIGEGDSFSLAHHPISTYLGELAELRKKHPALANGALQIRYAKGPIFAFSKRAIGDRGEYLVVLNNSPKEREISIQTGSNSSWIKLLGDAKAINEGSIAKVKIAPLAVGVFQAKRAISDSKVRIVKLMTKTDFLSGLHKLSASVESKDVATAEFFIKQQGKSWQSAGVDLNRPFAIYLNPAEFPGKLKFKVVITNSKGEKYESKQQAFATTTP